jgi:Na+-driven multidrug efflux pump
MISLARGLVILLACIFVLPALFGMTGVWLAAPVTEGVTLGITAWFLRGEKA